MSPPDLPQPLLWTSSNTRLPFSMLCQRIQLSVCMKQIVVRSTTPDEAVLCNQCWPPRPCLPICGLVRWDMVVTIFSVVPEHSCRHELSHTPVLTKRECSIDTQALGHLQGCISQHSGITPVSSSVAHTHIKIYHGSGEVSLSHPVSSSQNPSTYDTGRTKVVSTNKTQGY